MEGPTELCYSHAWQQSTPILFESEPYPPHQPLPSLIVYLQNVQACRPFPVAPTTLCLSRSANLHIIPGQRAHSLWDYSVRTHPAVKRLHGLKPL